MTRIIDAITGGIFGGAAVCLAFLGVILASKDVQVAHLQTAAGFGLVLLGTMCAGIWAAEKHFKGATSG